MPKGPPVHEIFNPPAAGKESSFHYEKKETKVQSQLTPKKTLAPLPPMKKFGGYKPKILGGNDDLIPISSNKPKSPDPPVENGHSRPSLTKPLPFIIGDKNTPMVLSTVDNDNDDSDDLDDRMGEIHIYEEPPMYFDSKETNVEVNNNINNMKNTMSSNFYNGEINNNGNSSKRTPSQSSANNNEAFSIPKDDENLIPTNHAENDPTTFARDNPIFGKMDTTTTDANESATENEIEPEGVFIPLPDYEEDERTMDFGDEDPDESFEEQRRVQEQKQRPQHQNLTSLKVYEGEDLSKYLSDDEDDFFSPKNNNTSKTMPVRLSQKHSLFKTSPAMPKGKRKTSNKNQAKQFNSVRNFSFADSKYGTPGKSGKKVMMGDVGGKGKGDYESFLTTSQQEGGYETFLRSKHGVGVGMDPSSAGQKGYRPQQNGKQGDRVWKKLTVRLKHKLHNKHGYDMEEQF